MATLLLLILCSSAFVSHGCDLTDDCHLTASDEGVALSLAQLRATQMSSIENGQTGVATSTMATKTVKPFNCKMNDGPIQVMKNPDANFDVKKLDVATGSYKRLYTIESSWSQPAFKTLNNCGISPISSVLYCIVKVQYSGGDFLVRVDNTHMEFVAKLPTSGNGNSATFSTDGYFYWGGGATEVFYVLDEQQADDLEGFATWSDSNLPDYGHFVEAEFVNVADIVVVKKDLRGNGVEEKFILGIGKNKNAGKKWALAVTEAEGPRTVFWLDTEGFEDLPQNAGAFGAAWLYQDRAFFSSNGGYGVYEVDMTSIDLNAMTGKVTLVGKSDTTSGNDGANCLMVEAPEEWVQIATCKAFGDPHVHGFDGSRTEGSDEEGDVWLVKSSQLSIQAQYEHVTDNLVDGIFMTKIAVGGPALGNNKLVFGKRDTASYWNDDEILTKKPSEFSNDYVDIKFRGGLSRIQYPLKTSAAIDVALPLGVSLRVVRRPRGVDVEIAMPKLEGGQDGECGNYNNSPDDDTTESIEQRSSLSVAAADGLFR